MYGARSESYRSPVKIAGVKPILDLLPPPGSLGDADAEAAIAQAADAFAASGAPDLPEPVAGWIARMRQAADKIESGAQIRRTGELIALAQFGAGSTGLLVGDACRDPGAAPRCEGCFIGHFLVDVAKRANEMPTLMPPDVAPQELFRRAEEAMRTPGPVTHPGLRRHLARRNALAARQIARLRRFPAGHRRAALTALDRLAVRIALLLRRDPAS